MARTSRTKDNEPDDAKADGKSTSSPSLGAAKAARLAAEQVAELTSREPIGIVGVEARDGGWRVDIEVIEAARIPSSTDMLATYSADLDADGALLSCRRASRYLRGSNYSNGDGS
ncbi:gas vesicle protein GvpO [Stackebrandtia nassauensis]|uniref:Gas vesicle synthesis family protein n=1 Tax=Stackebrandtia nassauensis (strain DSM 44728 / CIP 108903 / NRRL B-16338 / NBRC 102104 / LLR-40K-21) TaxID=446470 RepID=D3Q7K4_STANL|nr:gas vesicle protein GvpO [Stackebrandtia nassauensis]ADD44346.1 Gas vesicle synthesis family protein [Stackebrandtia nassauensis DSM 44728]